MVVWLHNCNFMFMVTGTEILEAQILDQTSDANSFLLPNKPAEATSVKTDQTQAKRDTAIPGCPQVRRVLWHSSGACVTSFFQLFPFFLCQLILQNSFEMLDVCCCGLIQTTVLHIYI